jgi:predicted alpha/beta hydrolase
LDISVRDGVMLHADVRDPPRGERLRGVAVLAHGLCQHRDIFHRASGGGLAPFLNHRGIATVSFDFRGHGDSMVPFAVSYDQFVTLDLPGAVTWARKHWPQVPVVVVGYDMGGHAALASEACKHLGSDGVAMIASQVWLPDWDPSFARRLMKRLFAATARRVLTKRGYFPCHLFPRGTDDEPASVLNALLRAPEDGRWCSDDFRVDYVEQLSRVKVPVLSVVSDGDRIMAPPICMERMASKHLPRMQIHRISGVLQGVPAPPAADLLLTGAAKDAWARIADFIPKASRPS